MKRIRNNSTKKAISAKVTRPDWEDYFCNVSFRMCPVNDASLSRFALAWVEAARNNPVYINIWHYPVLEAGLHEQTVRDWKDRNADVENAHRYVRSLCAIRRDIGAATRDLDGNWVAKTMPIYSEDHKALEEWRAHLSEKIASAGGLKVVEMEKFADSDLVPKKK